MGEPNILLKALIQEAGFSNAGLAKRIRAAGLDLRYDHTSVARWIRDRAIPRGQVPEIICDLLGERLGRKLTPADIGMEPAATEALTADQLVQRASARWNSDATSRKIIDLRIQTGLNALIPVVDWEVPFGESELVRQGGRTVGYHDVAAIRLARDHFEQMYRRVGGVAVRPRVVAYLSSHVSHVLKSSYDDSVGRKLYRAVGGLVAVAGICAYDADLHGTAQRYYFDALELAKASGDRAFGSYIIDLLATQAFLLGDDRQVLRYAEAGLRGVAKDASPRLAADLHTMRAKALARQRDRRGSHRHIQLADTVASTTGDQHLPEDSYVQAGHLECRHAETLASLGDLRPARRFAEQSVGTAADAHPRSQVHRLAVLADVLIAEGKDLELAVDTGARMLALARGMESHRIRGRLGSLRANLAGSTDYRPALELIEQIDSALALPF